VSWWLAVSRWLMCQRCWLPAAVLCDPRDEFVAARTQAVCRLYRLLAELSRPGASAVSGLPGRVAGIGWVVVVPPGPAFSPRVILADMQLEEGDVGEAEPA
jgi:hypothetical protein